MYSMLLDQLEIAAETKKTSPEERRYHIQSRDQNDIVDLENAKQFVIGFWKKFHIDGKDRKFKVVPIGF